MEEPAEPQFCHNKKVFDSPDTKVPAASTFCLSLLSRRESVFQLQPHPCSQRLQLCAAVSFLKEGKT